MELELDTQLNRTSDNSQFNSLPIFQSYQRDSPKAMTNLSITPNLYFDQNNNKPHQHLSTRSPCQQRVLFVILHLIMEFLAGCRILRFIDHHLGLFAWRSHSISTTYELQPSSHHTPPQNNHHTHHSVSYKRAAVALDSDPCPANRAARSRICSATDT